MFAAMTFIAGMLYARDISKLYLQDFSGVKMTASVIFESAFCSGHSRSGE